MPGERPSTRGRIAPARNSPRCQGRSSGVRIARRLAGTGAGCVTNEGRYVLHVERLVRDPTWRQGDRAPVPQTLPTVAGEFSPQREIVRILSGFIYEDPMHSLRSPLAPSLRIHP